MGGLRAGWIAASHLAVAAHVAGNASGSVLVPHIEVSGAEVTVAEVRPRGGPWRSTGWSDLGGTRLDPALYEVRLRIDGARDGDAIQIPACAGRKRILVEGHDVHASPAGPAVVPLAPGDHEVLFEVEVSSYERRIACGEAPRVGVPAPTVEGLGVLSFDSPLARLGGGKAVVYVPPGHDVRRAGPVLVGAHPWNGSIWTYAAYDDLLREARLRDVLLLMPSGLGNSLYTSDAEDEVLRAIDALSSTVAVDAGAVSIWGASMGGAGATTIGLHHPDHFASVTSFFGDSRYDLSTYVRSILRDERAAHRVNAYDVVENARYLPVWLIHGEADVTSPVRQSEILAAALTERGYRIRFDRVAGFGHQGALVARYARELVDVAAGARVPATVERVTYRSVRPEDIGAYGVRIVRTDDQRDAFVDVERLADGVHVRRHEGVREVVLARGALGASREHPPAIRVDDARFAIGARWEAEVE
jgi:enterochelin esterase-like enzyme